MAMDLESYIKLFFPSVRPLLDTHRRLLKHFRLVPFFAASIARPSPSPPGYRRRLVVDGYKKADTIDDAFLPIFPQFSVGHVQKTRHVAL